MKKLVLATILSFFGITAWAQEEASLLPSEIYRIEEIPAALKEVIINDERDIADVVGQLTRRESESFRYDHSEHEGNQTVYVFREWINDIYSDNLIEVRVDNNTRRIIRFNGRVRRNINLPTIHALSEQQAIERVLVYIKRGGKREFDVPIVAKGVHEAMLLYRGEELWWGIGIEIERAPDGVTDPTSDVWSHEWFWVSPKGSVQPWVEGGTVHGDVEVCDGAGVAYIHCSATQTPTVINHAGQCQAGYTCTGNENEYQTPWDTAPKVEDMWEDLRDSTGCCDIGENNAQYGGDLEINVGGDTGGAAGTYSAKRMGPSQAKRAVMVLDIAKKIALEKGFDTASYEDEGFDMSTGYNGITGVSSVVLGNEISFR